MIPDPLGDAARWLAGGGLLAYPTETVWGLAADARSEAGVERLRHWKGRGESQPLSLLVEGLGAARDLGCEIGAQAERLARAFWPGPLTLVVPCRPVLAPGVARGDGAVGLRSSSHPLARAFARRLAREGLGPATATSLNHSGEPPAQSVAQARALCGDSAEQPRLLPIEGAEAGGDAATTVVDLTGARPEVLRWGALREEELAPHLRAEGGA